MWNKMKSVLLILAQLEASSYGWVPGANQHPAANSRLLSWTWHWDLSGLSWHSSWRSLLQVAGGRSPTPLQPEQHKDPKMKAVPCPETSSTAMGQQRNLQTRGVANQVAPSHTEKHLSTSPLTSVSLLTFQISLPSCTVLLLWISKAKTDCAALSKETIHLQYNSRWIKFWNGWYCHNMTGDAVVSNDHL